MTDALTLTTRLERQHIPTSGGLVHLLIRITAQNPLSDHRLPLNPVNS